jgi:GTP pyrophosphokinase
LPVLEKIREQFGESIANIVKDCSEPLSIPKPPWKERKNAYIAQIADAGNSVKRVACADKLHNLRSILTDHQQVGDRVWDRFHADKEGTLWFYQSMVKTLRTFGQNVAIFVELEKRVGDLQRIVNKNE